MSNEKGIILHRRGEQEVLNNIGTVPLRSITKLETERLATHENGIILLRDIIFRPRTKVKLSEIVQGDYNPTNDLLMIIDDLAPEYNEIYITDFDNQLSIDRPEGIVETEATTLFHSKQDTSGMIRRDGTNDLDSAYVPVEDMDVVSKKYIDDQDFVRVDTPVMNNGYSPIEDFQVYTTDDIPNELWLRLPTQAGEPETLWNDSGVIRYVPIPPRVWARWAPTSITAYQQFGGMSMSEDNGLIVQVSQYAANEMGKLFVYDKDFNEVFTKIGEDTNQKRIWADAEISGNLVMYSYDKKLKIVDITSTLPDVVLQFPTVKIDPRQYIHNNSYTDLRCINSQYIVCGYAEGSNWSGESYDYASVLLYSTNGTLVREITIPNMVQVRVLCFFGDKIVVSHTDDDGETRTSLIEMDGTILKTIEGQCASQNDQFLVFPNYMTTEILLYDGNLDLVHRLPVPLPDGMHWNHSIGQVTFSFVSDNKIYMGTVTQGVDVHIFDLDSPTYEHEVMVGPFEANSNQSGFTTPLCKIDEYWFVSPWFDNVNGEWSGGVYRAELSYP